MELLAYIFERGIFFQICTLRVTKNWYNCFLYLNRIGFVFKSIFKHSHSINKLINYSHGTTSL